MGDENGDQNWAAMEKELLRETSTDSPTASQKKKERTKHLKKMGVTKFVEGQLPSLDLQRRMSEDVEGSADSTELQEELKRARAAYIAEGEEAEGEGEGGTKKSRKSSKRPSAGNMKKSSSKTVVTPEVITVGAVPVPPAPIAPQTAGAGSETISKKGISKRGSSKAVFDVQNDDDDAPKRRSISRVKSLKESKSHRLSHGRDSLTKRPSVLGPAPPPLDLPPLDVPEEPTPAEPTPADNQQQNDSVQEAPKADSEPSLPPPLPIGDLPPPLAIDNLPSPISIPAVISGDGSDIPPPPPPPPMDDKASGKRNKTLKRHKSTGSLKKIVKKDSTLEPAKVQPNEKGRPRMLDNVLRLVPSMYDDPKSIPKPIFTFDQKETMDIIVYLGDDEEDTEDYNLEFPAVKGGIIEKLIVGLTPENYSDPDFTFSFLLNYRSILTPERLLYYLELRWNLPMPTKGNVDAETFNKKKRTPIRLRIFNVMKLWIDEHFPDLESDPEAVKHVERFISEVIAKDMPGPAAQLQKQLKDRLEGKYGNDELQFDQKPPKPYLPMNIKGKLSVLDLHPEEVARQITLIDHQLFRSIKPREFLNTAWMKPDKEQRAPGILNMINNFNKISRWVATEIVRQADLKQRALVLLRFICIAHFCLELNNFNGVMCVIAALQNSAIHRLYKTWELLPQKAFDMFESMALLMNGNAGEGNFHMYRERLRRVCPPVVPYLGVFLTDLTFLNDGNPDYLDAEKRLVNFNKMAKIGRVVRTIMTYQQTPYCLAPVDFIREYILNQETLSEDEQYKESVKIEEKIPKAQRMQQQKDKKKVKPIDVDFKALNIDVDKDKK